MGLLSMTFLWGGTRKLEQIAFVRPVADDAEPRNEKGSVKLCQIGSDTQSLGCGDLP